MRSFHRLARIGAVALVAVTAAITATSVFATGNEADSAGCGALAGDEFVHSHASGLYSMGIKKDRDFDKRLSVSEERQRLANSAGYLRDHSSIITHTEANKDGHWKDGLLKPGTVGECWSSYRGNEYGVEWNSRRWKRLDSTAIKLTDETTTGGRPLYAAVVRLEERATPGARKPRQLIVIASHLPAHVEDAWSDGSPQVRAYKAAIAGLRHAIRARVAAFPKAAVIVSADWNLDHRKVGLRHAINGRLEGPGYNIRPNWPSDYPVGTFGKRLIDADWYMGLTHCGGTVHDGNASSDHRSFQSRYAIGSGGCS